MAVPEVSFRDGSGALKTVNGHLGTDGSYTFNSSPDTNVSTFQYAIQVSIPTTQTSFAVIQGSATKTVRIREITLVPVSDTASIQGVEFYRASSAGTTGSAVWNEITACPHEAAQSATGKVYEVTTAVPTVAPPAVAISDTRYMFVADAGDFTSGAPVNQVFKYGEDGTQAMVLRGVNEYFVLSNDGAATNSGTTYYLTIKLTEESE